MMTVFRKPFIAASTLFFFCFFLNFFYLFQSKAAGTLTRSVDLRGEQAAAEAALGPESTQNHGLTLEKPQFWPRVSEKSTFI